MQNNKQILKGNLKYLMLTTYYRTQKNELEKLGRGNTWFDVGTYQTLLEASEFVSTQLKIGRV